MVRNRAWADTVLSGGQIVDEQSSLTNLLLNAPTVDTLTAVRIVLDLVVIQGMDEPVADKSNNIHVGIGVASTEAFAQGINALPEPVAANEYPPRGWLYVNSQPTFLRAYRETAAVVGGYIRAAEFKADLRSMRKIDKGILYLVVQNFGVLGTADVDLWGRVRVLCLT